MKRLSEFISESKQPNMKKDDIAIMKQAADALREMYRDDEISDDDIESYMNGESEPDYPQVLGKMIELAEKEDKYGVIDYLNRYGKDKKMTEKIEWCIASSVDDI